MLIEKGADVNAQDKKGGTALIKASEHGHTDLTELLINAGADVNAQTNWRVGELFHPPIE